MLPDTVSQFLLQLEADRVQPYVMLLDRRFRLLQSWGDTGVFGLKNIDSTTDVCARLPFLKAMSITEVGSIACIDIGIAHAVDVHVLPTDGQRAYVIIDSVEAQRQQRQKLQQTANEARLLQQRQQKLIDQLIETRSELELRRHEAEEAMRGKSRFLASMSHEFRTPLTSVIGYAQWLAQAMDKNDPARRQASAIVRAGRHMVSLVDNILAQASLENAETTVHKDSVDLRLLAEDMSSIMAPLAADKGLAFAVFLEPQTTGAVELDDMRVRQILINLLANAVKFTENGFVQLTLRWAAETLHAEIADSGPGIAEQDQSRIFAAFERIEGAQSHAGAGLGLHITLQLVRLLGGSIELDSEPGQGSHFHIRLPAPLAPEPESEAELSDAIAGARLLIAEDDPDIVQLMDLFLSRAGYRLEFAGNGRDAVDRVLTQAPDMVILDLNMPVMDGISAVQKMREGGHTGPVIALTGATLDADRIRAIEAGFDGFVTKPIRMPELIATLSTLMS